MKPDETKSVPLESILNNRVIFKKTKILGPDDIEELVDRYNNEKNNLRNIWNNIPHWIMKADLGRYLYIYYNGGFYFDIDFAIKKNFLEHVEENVVVFLEIIASNFSKIDYQNKFRIANFAFGVKNKEHPFIKLLIEECIKRLNKFNTLDKNISYDKKILWVCGPDVMTTVYHKYKRMYRTLLLDRKYFNHLQYGSWR